METNSTTNTIRWNMGLSIRQRQTRGFCLSFLLHTLILCFFIFLGQSIPDFTPQLVIDFSLEEVFEEQPVQDAIEETSKPAKIASEPEAIAPVEEIPPEQVEPSEKTEPEPEPSPSQPAFVEESVVVVKKITTSRQKKKRVVKKKGTNLVKPATTPQTEKRKIADATIVKENTPLTRATAHVPVERQRKIKPAVQSKERYIKEHFLYIRDNVQGKISYPIIARKNGWQGKVLISFTILKDGSVKDIRIVKSSGFKILDKNAMDAIEKIAPFPKPPVAAELTIPVFYKLS